MKYALLFSEPETEFARREGADAEAYWGAWSAYIDELDNSGALVRGSGAGLTPPHSATTVRLRQGIAQIHDGPISDTKEQLGGVVVIDVPSLDVALEWAQKAPCVSSGAVEVRPVLPPPQP
jgi:hypothetical protein